MQYIFTLIIGHLVRPYMKRQKIDHQKKKKDFNIYRYMFLWFNSYGFFCQMNSII